MNSEFSTNIEILKSFLLKGLHKSNVEFYLKMTFRDIPNDLKNNSDFVLEAIKLVGEALEKECITFSWNNLFEYLPEEILKERKIVVELSKRKFYKNYQWLDSELQSDNEIIQNIVNTDIGNFLIIPFEKKTEVLHLEVIKNLNQVDLRFVENVNLENVAINAYVLFFQSNNISDVIDYCLRVFETKIHENPRYDYVRDYFCSHLYYVLFKCFETINQKKESVKYLKATIKSIKKHYSHGLKYYTLFSRGHNWYENNLFMDVFEYLATIELGGNKKFSEEKILLNGAFIGSCKNIELREKLIQIRLDESKEQLLKRIKSVSRLDWLVSNRDITQFPTNYANSELLQDSDIVYELSMIKIRKINYFS
jgi:hypothetical protein